MDAADGSALAIGSGHLQVGVLFGEEDVHPLFMGVNSEPVGKNFLYMLTRDDYATVVKEAYDKLDADKQAAFAPTIEEMEAEAADLGLTGENAKYALAWIKLWCTQYQEETDDGPICNIDEAEF